MIMTEHAEDKANQYCLSTNKKKREVGNMAQVVEHLSSNLSTTLKTKKGPKHI
jgi:hypothetical protein